MYQKRCDFGITYDTAGKNVYVIGGNDGEYLDHCEKFCTITNKWTVIAPMNQKKRNASVCIFNNQFIFAIGGYNNKIYNKHGTLNNKFLKEIEKYEIETNTWQTIEITGDQQLSVRRCYSFCFQTSSSSILIAGGNDGRYKKDCLLLDTTKNTLKTVCNLPHKDQFKSSLALIFADYLFAFGLNK